MELTAYVEQLVDFEHYSSQQWIRYLVQHEAQLPESILKLQAHCINVHHIWAARMLGKSVESNDWDALPVHTWERLMEQNFRWTEEYLQHHPLDALIKYTTSEGETKQQLAVDLLYHLLHHATHHRGQIAHLARKNGIEPLEINFITHKKGFE